jgi:hypothetical protein
MFVSGNTDDLQGHPCFISGAATRLKAYRAGFLSRLLWGWLDFWFFVFCFCNLADFEGFGAVAVFVVVAFATGVGLFTFLTELSSHGLLLPFKP